MDKQKKTSIIILVVLALLGTAYHFVWGGSESASDNPAILSDGEWVRDKELMSRLEIPYRLEDNEGTVIEHMGYALSYNSEYRVPNWVAYELTREEARGTHERGSYFVLDPDLETWCPSYKDYSSSVYDRGHMAPAGDMKWDQQAMEESFYMTNVCPQDHDLNGGDWRILEEQIRRWAIKYGNIYIVCGPLVSDQPERIGRSGVAVPDGFFKVVLCKINGQWQSIGFLFDNNGTHHPLKYYSRSIDEVERLTGIDFFHQLDDAVEDRIEADNDPRIWGLAK